jgi:putative DNA methylase
MAVAHASHHTNSKVQEVRLPLEPPVVGTVDLIPARGARLIENDSFPFEQLSEVAERESWRKEVYRPVYHMHKWWAQRLGSVFRGLVIASMAGPDADLMDLFYRPVRIKGATIFDPFMGSGTTVGESLKLGTRAIGRDINPVSYFAVRNALAVHPKADVLATYRDIEESTSAEIRSWYRAKLPGGGDAEALYYFWVKVLACPTCESDIDLFSSTIFSRNAYPKRVPEARSLCPHCGGINVVRYDATEAQCESCASTYNPQRGPAHGQKASCPCCHTEFSILAATRQLGHPPTERMYAKLVLTPGNEKRYLPVDDFDLTLFQEAEAVLAKKKPDLPSEIIAPGYNTNQALSNNYRQWHQFFNPRQLLNITTLSGRIKEIESEAMRDVFTCLLSGVLEFNNMFASFKGEGTGAVRHMFSHHVLKPERTPLEANLWGTKKSSGSFSTLFERRLLKGIEYADEPFELGHPGVHKADKIFGLSSRMGRKQAVNYSDMSAEKTLYLSCGDSSVTDLPSKSVDAVITDPPFFDNVNYSQLADFFYAWQRIILGDVTSHMRSTTRSDAEVQTSDVDAFADRLGLVWAEAHRVLRDDGLLVFSYHHSRAEGWWSVLSALMQAGFVITASQPIKAEMSVAAPKQQAKEPIDLDIILVCRKREAADADLLIPTAEVAFETALTQVERFRAVGRKLSRNDVRVIVMGQLLRVISSASTVAAAEKLLQEVSPEIERRIGAIHGH